MTIPPDATTVDLDGPLDPRQIRMAGLAEIGAGIQRTADAIEKRSPGEAASLRGTGQAIEAIGKIYDGFTAPYNRIATLRDWAASRIAHCRAEELKFSTAPSRKNLTRASTEPHSQTVIEAAQERRTLEDVLRILDASSPTDGTSRSTEP